MKSLVLILFVALPMFAFSQPNVNAIEPIQGDIGSTVSILGTGFSSVILDNSVYFGNIQAEILSSSENQIQAIVPYGSTNSKITVFTNGLMSSSNIRFNITFDSEEELTIEHLANQLDNPYLGRTYYDIKIADLNGDGIPEIVTSEAGYGSSAYLALFTTSFNDEGMISIDQHIEFNFGTGVYSEPHDIAIGDVNGDGLLDVLVSEKGTVNDNFEAHTCIFINASQNQSFAFESPITIDGDGYEAFVQLQDINGDGKLDILTTRETWNQVGVYLNTSDGNSVSFENKIIISNVLAYGQPDFADLNGDGKIDMVTTSYDSNNNSRDVFVYLNNSTDGNIEFNLEVTILSGGETANWPTDYNWSAYSPTLVDVDGDGRLDIIVANGNCFGCSPSGISILKNISTNSELGFEYENSDFYYYESNTWPTRINISDINGDGKPDILTTDWQGGISIIVNISTEGNILLEEQIQLDVGNFPLAVVTSDLNMDFTPEIIVANWEVEGLRIIHNFILSTNEVVYGCIDSDACNFNEEATNSNSSCIYPEIYLDCNGNCLTDIDLDGECDELDYDDGIGIDEVGNTTQTLIKMIDILGREQKEHKQGRLLFYFYDNGKIQKKMMY